MERHVRDINRGRADVLELLLKLEEAVFDLFLNILRQLFFRAYEFWVLRMAAFLHDLRAVALESLLELVDTLVGHRYLLVLIDLLGGLGRDAVDRGAS